MATNGTTPPDTMAMLQEILSSVRSLKHEHSELSASVDAINGRVNTLAGIKQIQDGVAHDAALAAPKSHPTNSVAPPNDADKDADADQTQAISPPPERRPSTTSTSKIILTSYPGQAGVDPIPLKWGKCKLSVLSVDKSAGTGYYLTSSEYVPIHLSPESRLRLRVNSLTYHQVPRTHTREAQSSLLVALPRSADATPLVLTAVRTASTTLSPWALNSSTLTTSPISPTPSLLPTSVHSLHGQTPRRSSPWTLLATWLRGSSRT